MLVERMQQGMIFLGYRYFACWGCLAPPKLKHVLRPSQSPVGKTEVPVPEELVKALVVTMDDKLKCRPIWEIHWTPVSRSTAYRWIKLLMERADIHGCQASPKGLRHGYGIHALQCGVPLNMLQKWMGHADMTTTAIYANACGAEEQEIAKRMW